MPTTSESESSSEVRVVATFDDVRRPPRATWIGVLADTLLLLVPLALANIFLARDDPGFLDFNPSPWILLPLILGARCGLLAGQSGALLAAVAVLLGFRFFENATRLTAIVTGEAWFFVSLLVAGAVGGLIHALHTGPTQAARATATRLARSEQRMRHDLELLRESESDLSQRLLLHGAEFISLQDRIRELLASPVESLDRGLLELCQELFGITRASIYQRKSGESWHLISCLGDHDSFPDRCHFDESKYPVAAAAILANDIATCNSALHRDASALAIPEPVSLIAIPWGDASEFSEGPHRLLLIDRMPFANAKWENFARIQALFLWLSTVAATAPRPDPAEETTELPEMLSPEQFETQLGHVLDCSEKFRLGYRLVLFERTASSDTTSQNAFVRSIRTSRRAGDTLGGIMIGKNGSDQEKRYGIALVLPVDTDAAAESRIAQILKPLPNPGTAIDYQIFPIAGQREEFLANWRSLTSEVSTPTLDADADHASPAASKSSSANSSTSSAVPPNPAQPA